MTAETTAEPPTLGEIYWDGYVAKAGIVNFPYTDLDQEAIDGIEAGAAAAGAAAIARLNQPAELAAAMTETRKIRDVLDRALEWFAGETGTRREAAITRAQLARAYRDGGLPVPSELVRFL